MLAVVLALLSGCTSPASRQASTRLRFASPELPAPHPAGPTLRLDLSGRDAPVSPIADFMYFVPLISPEPVTMTASAGNTQQVRVTAMRRRVAADSFSVECDFEVTGDGSLLNTFDHGENIRRNEKKLRDGGALERVLDSITVHGAGAGSIEVEGVITNRLAAITEVRLRFNTRGQPSPVSIGLADIRFAEPGFCRTNEHVARVNTLTFRATTNASPRMAVTVASVKRKDAGGGLWGKFTGAVTGLAANMFLKPIKVDRAGHEAMLNFGRQLAVEAPSFTFPRAKNLKAAPAAAP